MSSVLTGESKGQTIHPPEVPLQARVRGSHPVGIVVCVPWAATKKTLFSIENQTDLQSCEIINNQFQKKNVMF